MIDSEYKPLRLFGRRIGPTTNGVYIGALVTIDRNASFWNGERVDQWYRLKRWRVTALKGNRAVLGEDETGRYAIRIPISTSFLTVIKNPEENDYV